MADRGTAARRSDAVSPASRLPGRAPRGEREPLAPTVSSGDIVASVARAEEHWVSADALRQAIGAWAYTLGAAGTRPGAEAVRTAVAVACALREIAIDPARRRWSATGDLPLEVPVPEDVGELARRSGYPAREVERALDLLTSARAATRQLGASVATVTLAGAMLAPLPAAARIAWEAARDRLHAVGGGLPSAQAVLRELAAMVGAHDAAGAAPAVRASVRDLEDATGFGRSTVSEALGALEQARLVDVETRAGRTTRFTLRLAAFGLPDEAPSRPAALEESPRAGAPSHAVRASAMEPSRSTPQMPGANARLAAGGAPVLIGEFAGTPIYGPPGTPLVVECDAEGRWTCRVGPFLRLGPIGPAE